MPQHAGIPRSCYHARRAARTVLVPLLPPTVRMSPKYVKFSVLHEGHGPLSTTASLNSALVIDTASTYTVGSRMLHLRADQQAPLSVQAGEGRERSKSHAGCCRGNAGCIQHANAWALTAAVGRRAAAARWPR